MIIFKSNIIRYLLSIGLSKFGGEGYFVVF